MENFYKTYKLPVYGAILHLVGGELSEGLRKKFDIEDEEFLAITTIVYEKEEIRGTPRMECLMYFKYTPSVITIGHEALHTASNIFEIVGVEFDYDNHEPWTYFIDTIKGVVLTSGMDYTMFQDEEEERSYQLYEIDLKTWQEAKQEVREKNTEKELKTGQSENKKSSTS